MPDDAVGAAGQALPVDDDETNDFAKRQRHDGEIIAAQPQHRKAEHHAPEGSQNAGERQADPERQSEIGRQQRIGIGADRVEGDIAEVEQAGEADHDIQSPSEHHIGQHQNAEIENVALIVENHREEKGENQKQRRDRAPRQPKRALHGWGHDRGCRFRSPPLPQQFDDDAADEHDANDGGEIAEPRPVNQLPRRACLGADADHQREQHQRNERADQGFLEDEGDACAARWLA